jgi:Family of unknown function (DUF6518)
MPGALRACGLVVLVAIVVGGLTSPAQQYLPEALRSLANAAGPWFVVVLVSVRLGRSPLALSILLGIVGFLLLNATYGVVSELRGFPYSPLNVWSIIAIPAGVVVGVTATWLDSKRRVLAVLAAAAPAIVLVAEGIYGLTVVLDTTGPVVWILELVGAAAWIAWVAARRYRSRERSSVVRSAAGRRS